LAIALARSLRGAAQPGGEGRHVEAEIGLRIAVSGIAVTTGVGPTPQCRGLGASDQGNDCDDLFHGLILETDFGCRSRPPQGVQIEKIHISIF
jgi:hypothetical protein